MADEKTWVDRLFGNGIVWSVFAVLFGLFGLYSATIKAGQSEDKIRAEFTGLFKNANDGLDGLKTRLVKLENSQAVAKVEAQGASLQANVAQLQQRYQKPEEKNLLSDFGTLYRKGQNDWLKFLDEHPADPAAITPSPPPALPKNLDFLQKNDKDHLGKLLESSKQTWTPPPAAPSIPGINWMSLQKETNENKSIPDKVWDTVKAYPWIVVLLLVVLLGAIFNKK